MAENGQDFVWDRNRAALEIIRNCPPPSPLTQVAHRACPTPTMPCVSTPLPVMSSDKLSANSMSTALSSAGCVVVKNLLSIDSIKFLIESIDKAFLGYDRRNDTSGVPDPWYQPFIPVGDPIHELRGWLRRGGGMLACDSPIILEFWLGLLKKAGVVEMIADYFGEQPLASVDKCTLRRITPGTTETGIEWHQDGSFLGMQNQPSNIWVSLSDCARSPGLEILPRRLECLVETGTHGAGYAEAIGDDLVRQMAVESPLIRPDMKPGDALVFDGLLLHRTAPATPVQSSSRYAIETWFFRPSSFPGQQRFPLAF